MCIVMALITTLVLCARSQDLVMLVSVRRVHVVLSAAGFKGGGKPCRKALTSPTNSVQRFPAQGELQTQDYLRVVSDTSISVQNIEKK